MHNYTLRYISWNNSNFGSKCISKLNQSLPASATHISTHLQLPILFSVMINHSLHVHLLLIPRCWNTGEGCYAGTWWGWVSHSVELMADKDCQPYWKTYNLHIQMQSLWLYLKMYSSKYTIPLTALDSTKCALVWFSGCQLPDMFCLQVCNLAEFLHIVHHTHSEQNRGNCSQYTKQIDKETLATQSQDMWEGRDCLCGNWSLPSISCQSDHRSVSFSQNHR